MFAINRYRNGMIRMRYGRRWLNITRRPQYLIGGRWRGARLSKGRILVRMRRILYRIKFRRGRLLRRIGRKWRRFVYKRRRGQRRRRLRRRKRRRFRRKLRRIRRRRRKRMRRLRRIRRYWRRASPLRINYRRKTSMIYRWKGRFTMRLGGQRRRIR